MTKTKNHAKETRTLRGRSRKDRQETVLSLRDLPGGYEAKKKRQAQIKPLGVHHNIAQPMLQMERDQLLDALWLSEKQRASWTDDAKWMGYRKIKWSQRRAMYAIFDNYIDDLKKRLLSLDERISPIRNGR